tara:strand:+ start:4195 stop:4545 length:351 start_codon:yes stop_codon:yes gene_type:complete
LKIKQNFDYLKFIIFIISLTMDNSSEDSWSEISNTLASLKKKIKEKNEDDSLVEDLKESFSRTIDDTSEILKNLRSKIDSTIKDEEIKQELKLLTDQLASGLKSNFSRTDNKAEEE